MLSGEQGLTNRLLRLKLLTFLEFSKELELVLRAVDLVGVNIVKHTKATKLYTTETVHNKE